MSVSVSFCCNDGRGTATGGVEGLHFQDSRGFAAALSGGVRFSFLEPSGTDFPQVRFSRRIFTYNAGSKRPWDGSIYWDGVRMSQSEAVRLLRYAIERGFQCEDWTLEGPFAKHIEELCP